MRTIHDIASEILQVSENRGKASMHSKPVTEGMKPKAPKLNGEGIYTLTPEEILTICVETVSMEAGKVVGYQRGDKAFRVRHARQIARSIRRGRNIAPPHLATDGNGKLYCPDGQHRLVGAVMARRPMRVIVEKLNEEERKERFADQTLAIRPRSEILILGRADTDPVAAYIRDAIEFEQAGLDHPLHGFVSLNGASKNRIGIATIYGFLASFATNRMQGAGRALAEADSEITARVTENALNEGARLLTAFGAKRSAHKLAYAPATVRALGDIAVVGVYRAPDRKKAVERWIRVMPSFNFDQLPMGASTYANIRPFLIRRWNRNLPEGFPKIDAYAPETDDAE